MGQIAQHSSNDRVEVSGWDAAEAFFSEKTVLYWSAAGQEIPLRSRLREGMVIFIRLLEPFGVEENFPVPYVVAKNVGVEIEDRLTVAIRKLHPILHFSVQRLSLTIDLRAPHDFPRTKS
jgi:hypothetical protein